MGFIKFTNRKTAQTINLWCWEIQATAKTSLDDNDSH